MGINPSRWNRITQSNPYLQVLPLSLILPFPVFKSSYHTRQRNKVTFPSPENHMVSEAKSQLRTNKNRGCCNFHVPKFPPVFYNPSNTQLPTPPVLLSDDLDVILEKSTYGPIYFVNDLALPPWLFDERYVHDILIGFNAHMALLLQTPGLFSAVS